MNLTYWYLFPLGIVISAVVMSAGISGANFWIPVYLFILKLDPFISFWLALLTMVFGFGSGVIRNLHQHTVNWYLVKKYLIPTIPGAIIGSLLTAYLDAESLVLIFGIFVFIYGTYLLYTTNKSKHECRQHDTIYWKFGFVAGLLKGLIATGLGKIIVPCIWDHERIRHPSEAIGSTVFIIFIVDIVAALTRMNPVFMDSLLNNWTQLVDIIIFVVPSVLIGGQLGPMAIKNVNKKELRIYISFMLIMVSLFIMGNVWSEGI